MTITIGEDHRKFHGFSFTAVWPHVLHRLFRNWLARGVVARLGRLDDEVLYDFGVKRSDIRWALDLPLTADAQAALLDRVRTRGRG